MRLIEVSRAYIDNEMTFEEVYERLFRIPYIAVWIHETRHHFMGDRQGRIAGLQSSDSPERAMSQIMQYKY